MKARRNQMLNVDRPKDVYAAYMRVSTKKQKLSRAGLKVQKRTIIAHAKMKRWTIYGWFVDTGSGKNMARTAFVEVMELIQAGTITGFMAAKLDRATRSVIDFERLLADAIKNGWNLVAVDLGVDLTTTSGRMVARTMANIAQWEREVISERTRDALAEKRRQGVRLGRPRSLPKPLLLLVVSEYHVRGSFSAVARHLNEFAIPTAQGGVKWYPATVSKMLVSQDALKILAKLERQHVPDEGITRTTVVL